MFEEHEGEALKEAVDSLRSQAADLEDQAQRVEEAWKHGDRERLESYGYLPKRQGAQ